MILLDNRKQGGNMKKFIVLLGLILLSVNCCFANSLEYKLELGKLKNAKSAKTKVIDIQINSVTQKVEATANDTTISPEKKQELIEQYTAEINSLNDQKTMANYTYKKAKKNLKKRH